MNNNRTDSADTAASGQRAALKRDADCPFCPPRITGRIIERHGSVFAIPDKYPVCEGHTLIVPFRHTPDFFSMTAQERQDADDLIQMMRDRIRASDASVTGFNIGMNCGQTAGQTIMHAHIHLIPRRAGDVENPKGGVRGAIPHKMHY